MKRLYLLVLPLVVVAVFYLGRASRSGATNAALSRPNSTTLVPFGPGDSVGGSKPASEPNFNVRFHWSQLEPGDLPACLTRLRAVGCPEETIRDIIIGMINRHYQTRLAALRQATAIPYWQTLDRRSTEEMRASLERAAALRELEYARDTEVRNLLGIEWAEHETTIARKSDRVTDLLDSVSPTARPEARRILESFALAEKTVAEKTGGTLGLAEQAELEQLSRQKLEALGKVLTSRELEDLELRISPLADRLRNTDLIGFSPTEDEFRKIYRISKQLEEPESLGAQATELADSDPPRKQIEAQLREALGEARFADYTRSQDLTYRRLVEFTSHYGLLADSASQVHDLRESVIQRVDKLTAHQDADPGQLQTTLRQIQTESASAVRQTIGDEAYGRYVQDQLGNWLRLVPTWTNGVVFRD